MAYSLLNPVNTNPSSPAPAFASNSLISASIPYPQCTFKVQITNHWRNRGGTFPNSIFVITLFPCKTGSNGIILGFKMTTPPLPINANCSNPFSASLLKFHAGITGSVKRTFLAIDCIGAGRKRPQIDSSIVQSAAVPMVNNPPTTRRDNYIVHVYIPLLPIFHYSPRRIKSLSFRIPPRIPRVLSQLLKIFRINKGKLPLRQGNTSVWSKFRHWNNYRILSWGWR